ncbi:DDE-type integrase/transposase/recombinase, partial [Streptomyces kronopolitis]|uniref:DDE-type integrase/transposase/recombinase n=1 Tax=Streptomyces kronopolitis TaxID=1612435 RepID=UPI0036872F3B
PDLVGRDFTASEPNTKYVGDITYLPLDGGKFLYLATVIDLASRRLAGWAIADHMRTDLVTDALAINNRPRKILGWRTPAEVFEEQLRSLQQPGVATTG